MGNNKMRIQTDLNTVEVTEYQQWINLLEGVCLMHVILKEHPNAKGLRQARSAAYNVLADIQMLVDSIEDQVRYAE